MNLIQFTSGNRLSYAILNKILNWFYNSKNDFDKKFRDYGYENVNLKSLNTISLIKKEIDLQKDDNQTSLLKFEINNNLFNLLSKLISEQKDLIKNLREFYSCPIVVSNIELKRTKYLDKSVEINKNVYSENYHIDKYLNTHVKQFIYLTDVDEKSGPFTYIDKKDTKKFITKYKYKNRFSINVNESQNLEKKEFEKKYIGKMGSSLVVNTTECLHRAGIPIKGNFRDIITITYVASPEAKYRNEKHFIEKFGIDFFKEENNFSKKLAKPNSKKEIIIFLLKYLKFKYFN